MAVTDHFVSVTAFGAVGDGVTDDTAAIQNAVNAAANQTLFFPSGTYRIASAQINVNASTEWLGESSARILLAGAGTRIFAKGISNFTIRNLEIDGNQFANHAEGISIVLCHHIEIDSVYIHHTWNSGIIIDSSNATPSSTDNSNFQLSSSHIEFTGGPGIDPHSQGCGIWLGWCTGILVSNCFFNDTSGDGAVFLADIQNAVVTNNVISHTVWRGIETFEVCRNIVIEGNQLSQIGGANTGNSGVGCNGIFILGGSDVDSSDVLIRSNHIRETAENGIEGAATIVGNVIINTGFYPNLPTPSMEGIYPLSNSVVEANYIVGAGGDGIAVIGQKTNLKVSNNYIMNAGSRSTGKAGIYLLALDGIVNQTQVLGNYIVDFQGKTSVGVLLESSGTGALDLNTVYVQDNHVFGIEKQYLFSGTGVVQAAHNAGSGLHPFDLTDGNERFIKATGLNSASGGQMSWYLSKGVDFDGTYFQLNSASEVKTIIAHENSGISLYIIPSEISGSLTYSQLQSYRMFYADTRGIAVMNQGVQTLAKNGVPNDTDWRLSPSDGTIVLDTTGNRLYARSNGRWLGTNLVQYGSAAPTDSVFYVQGTQVLNTNPVPGSFVGWINCRSGLSAPIWKPSASHRSGDYVVPTSDNGWVYKCITTGKSSLSEPVWPTVVQSIVGDGTVQWQAYSNQVALWKPFGQIKD